MGESTHFSVSSAADGGAYALRLWGELDPLGAILLTRALADLTFDDLREVRVDCGDLTFLDSAGIAALLELRNRASAAGAWFALDRLPAAPRRVIEIAGLVDILQVDDDGPG